MSDVTRHKKGEPRPSRGSKPGERRGNAGKGRKPGSKNKVTKALKEQILGALEAAGGQTWLEEQMKAQPVAFMTLIGKILPSEMTLANPDGSGLFSKIERVVIDARKK